MAIIERNIPESIQVQVHQYKRQRGGDGKLKHVKSKTITVRGIAFEEVEARVRNSLRDDADGGKSHK